MNDEDNSEPGWNGWKFLCEKVYYGSVAMCLRTNYVLQKKELKKSSWNMVLHGCMYIEHVMRPL